MKSFSFVLYFIITYNINAFQCKSYHKKQISLVNQERNNGVHIINHAKLKSNAENLNENRKNIFSIRNSLAKFESIPILSFLMFVAITFSPSQVLSSQYDVYSNTYDKINGMNSMATTLFNIESLRKIGGEYVTGDVLEVAVGTGLQMKYNNWNNIKSYTGIDESKGMLTQVNTVYVDILNTVYINISYMQSTFF
jgi:hypothetical protein